MKIGFLEKWNKDASMKEFSITRLQMAAGTVFFFIFIYMYFVAYNRAITIEALLLVVILGIFATAPKMMKDLADIRDKLTGGRNA